MNKKFTKLMAAFALLVFMAPCMAGWGQTSSSVSSLIFTAKCNGSGTADDGAMYTVSSDANESNFDETRGIHYGTGSAAVSYLNLSTSNISGTITKIVVNASGASSTSAVLNVTVGGSAFGTEKTLSSTATAYTFEGSASGDIIVAITQTSAKKALYCKSIVVTYTPSSGPVSLTAPSLTATPGNGQISVSWDQVSNAISYTLCWADNANFTNATEIENATSPKVIENLTNGTTYYFKAKSIGNGTSYISSGYGDVVNAVPAIPQLGAPVIAAEAGNGEVTLTWETVSNASSYTIQYAANPNFTDATMVENATSPKVISGLTNNTTYYFKAMSIGDGTNYLSSDYGISVSATPSNIVTFIITQDNLSGFTNSYNWYTWSSGGISGNAYAFKNAGIQVNPTKDGGPDCIYNTTPIPGTIKSIKMVKASGTTRAWTVTVGTTTLTSTDDGQTLEAQTVNTGTTWNVEGDYTNFLLSVSEGSTVIESIEIKYEPKTQYDVNVADLSATYGTITATPTSAIEGATVSLSVSPNSDYRFDSFVVTNANTNEPIMVTSTGTNTGTFTMPASAVNVTGTFTRLYTVTILDGIENGTVTASPLQAAEGEEITLTAEPAQHYEFNGDDDWLVMYGEESETVDVVDNKFNMPAADVGVFAYFTQKTYTITYCVNGNLHAIAPAQVLGGNSIGTFPTDPEYGTSSFLGWSTTEGGANYVSTSYVPTSDITLYAVFGTMDEALLTITGTTSQIPTAYGSGTWVIDSKNFFQKDILYQNPSQHPVIQFKNSSGVLYNQTDFGAIHSIVLNYYSGTNAKAILVKAGASENPTDADAIAPYVDTETPNVYVYALPENCHYFLLKNGSGTSQVSSIEIYYETLVPASITITRISDVQTISSLSENQILVVENGGELTFTGTNNDPANIIVEDGGQLITDVVVEATIQKNIKAYTVIANDVTDPDNVVLSNGWYFISSPLNSNGGWGYAPTEVINLIPNNVVTSNQYDLYSFDPNEELEWVNYKGHQGEGEFLLYNGHGYLYANANDVTLEFAGSLNYPEPEISLENGYNLVGNPYAYNAYPSMSYYKMNTDGTGIEATECSTSVAVAPCTGILVNNEDGNTPDITFSRTAPNAKGGINLALAEAMRGATQMDNAIVSFNEGSQLGKFYFGTQNANLYIPQGIEEYAIVSTESQGEMPINFRANEDGQYTLTVNPENVDMNYLHLIDNMTGMDVDLLQTPSYTFNATTRDYESRFRLVFAANNEDGVSTGSTAFAFYSNGSWIINNAGEATLQVIDVTGRVLSSETVSGSVSKTINATPGVYMLRLINGDNVNVQKIVVR